MKDEIKLLASEVTLTSATNFSENTRNAVQSAAGRIHNRLDLLLTQDGGGRKSKRTNKKIKKKNSRIKKNKKNQRLW